MSLKIRINRQNIVQEHRPSKRRIQRIESEDEDEDTVAVPCSSSYDLEPAGSRSKKARTVKHGASAVSEQADYVEGAVEEDVDIDGDIEDTRFLPDPPSVVSHPISPMHTSVKRRLSNAAPSSSKAHTKEKESKSTKSSKSAGKKPRRQVVWTDDEDEEFDDPNVVVTDDDNFDPEPEYSSKKAARGKSGKAAGGKAAAKGKGARAEEKEITFRDERKLYQPPSDPFRREEAVGRREDDGFKGSIPYPLDEPIPKKRKLPPIKKNKPAGVGSTAPSTPASKPVISVAGERKETLTAAPTSNQVGIRKPAGASADLNLLDSSVYSELFKSAPGGTTPNSGLNRKQKEEERKKELLKMRDEARAKREADAVHDFDLQASPEKIQRFEEVLRSRHSMARYPNILGASFKEMYDRHSAHAAPPVA